MKLADCCAEQGSYHLATKKYTQGGDKAKVNDQCVLSEAREGQMIHNCLEVHVYREMCVCVCSGNEGFAEVRGY